MGICLVCSAINLDISRYIHTQIYTYIYSEAFYFIDFPISLDIEEG